MSHLEEIAEILTSWPPECHPHQVRDLGSAGGFSGARFWQLATQHGTLCLRRWPREHPSPERLRYIHAVLWDVADAGLPVATPLFTTFGETFVRSGGHLWELTPWMSGRADYPAHPSPARLQAALTMLARFHLAAANSPVAPPRRGPSPGLAQRLARLEGLLAPGGLSELHAAIQSETWPAAAEKGRRLLTLFSALAPAVLPELRLAVAADWPLQACLRDIWHDHVFFEGDQVCGLVDFGALREETPAADIARLLGSLAADEAESWRLGLAAYEAVRPLGEVEQKLVRLFDRTTCLLGGLNWLTWIFVEQRRFERSAAVEARLDEFVGRLEFAARAAEET